jgi:acetamidase/formamidase
MHRISRDDVIWSFGPDLAPVLEVEPGDTVTFETNDCFTGQIRSEDDLVTEIDLSRINSATGPVAVKEAEPGDSLVVEILDVRPIEWGVATLIPGFGQLIDQVRSPVTRLFDVRDGEICFTGVEIAGEVDVRFDLLKGRQATWPVTELADRWLPHATADAYGDALKLVAEEAAKLLVDEHGFTVEDAFIFLSVACDAGVTQACKPAEGFGTIARFSIPKLEACPGPFSAHI